MRVHQLTNAKNKFVVPRIRPSFEFFLLVDQIDRVRMGQTVRVKERVVPPLDKAAPFGFGTQKPAHCHDGRSMAIGFVDISGPNHVRRYGLSWSFGQSPVPVC
jgi:hypothetical protein